MAQLGLETHLLQQSAKRRDEWIDWVNGHRYLNSGTMALCLFSMSHLFLAFYPKAVPTPQLLFHLLVKTAWPPLSSCFLGSLRTRYA